MTLTFPPATRTVLCDALVDLLDAGAGAGYLEVRSGTRPTSAADTATGTLLATIALDDPAFGAASSGVATVADPDAVTAAATGTATWFRAYDSDDTARFDGKVTETSGGGDLELATVDLTSGFSVDITGGTITCPAGTAD